MIGGEHAQDKDKHAYMNMDLCICTQPEQHVKSACSCYACQHAHFTSIIQRTVKQEVKCCGVSDILHEIFRDTPRKAEKLIRVVSQTSLCSISDSPLHLIFLLIV